VVKIDVNSLERDYQKYIELHRRMEKIDSAIIYSMGNFYFLKDNYVDVHTDGTCKDEISDTFETDLVYVSQSLREILFVEETTDPSNKLKQMNSYQHISSQSLRMITGADTSPALDVMVVFPMKFREEGLTVYQSLVKSPHLGKKLGLSLWCYSPKMDKLKCVGGCISDSFPYKQQEMPISGIGMLKILKKPHPLFLLKFIVLRAIENQYGEASDEGIEFDKEKLLKWLKPYGIVNESLWRVALQLGSDVKWIEQYSSEQLTGIIKFTKPSPKSISQSKQLMFDFSKAISEEFYLGDKQKRLFDYYDESEGSELNGDDDNHQ